MYSVVLYYSLALYTLSLIPSLRPWKTRTRCGHIVADTLLWTQMFPRLLAGATFVADKNFVSGTQHMFLILFRNVLCPQLLFPSLCNMETQH